MDSQFKKIKIAGWAFFHLNLTQFLGALNDNIYKWLLIYLLIDSKGPAETNAILAFSGVVFVLPFLLFSSFCGTLADNHSKTTLLRLAKVLEVLIMSLGALALFFQHEGSCYLILFLMAAQSTLFSPAKYGILPELFEESQIPGANGWLTLFTNIAIVMGAFLASWITDLTERNFFVAGLICTAIAFLGAVSSFLIPQSGSAKQGKKLKLSFWKEVFRTLCRSRSIPYLLSVILANSCFYAIASYCQLNIVSYSMAEMGKSETRAGYLSPAIAIGIGIGSLMAAHISKGKVRLDFMWKAALGIGVVLQLLFFTTESFSMTFLAFLSLGICGGFYIVPTDSYLQLQTPHKDRGEMIGSSNVMAFFGVMVGSLLLFVVGNLLGLQPKEGFRFVGLLSVALAALLWHTTRCYCPSESNLLQK